MKQNTTIRLEEGVMKYARAKGNVSRYIQGLIKQDMATESQKPIVKAVKEELLRDEEFFEEVVNRVILKSRNY